MSISPTDNAKIVAYWAQRKHGFSTAEMEDLYRLLVPLLMRTRLPAELTDQRERANLIHAFIAERFLINGRASNAGPLANAYALHLFLRNYAISWLRERDRDVSLDEDADAVADLPEDDDASCSYANSIMAELRQLLTEAGINVEHAGESAERFLGSLDPAERTYLARNTCAEEEDREPISRIADRLALGANYHSKARLLGITGSKGGFFQGYENTKIGKWLVSVGATINAEWQRELVALLAILCERALTDRRAT
jgi:hypothetical protein